MPYKNWQAICGLQDDLFRLLVAMTKDPYILAGLEKGFPELFSEEETILRVPASAIRERAQEYSMEQEQSNEYGELDANISWGPILHEFNIPIIGNWHESDSIVPHELLRQLVGQRFEAGMTVEYRGIQCLVAYISCTNADDLHGVIHEVRETEFLTLIAADCVDLNS